MAADRDAGVDPRFDPVFQRGYDASKNGGPSREAQVTQEEDEPRGRNPFQLALLLMSIVSAGGAIWLYWRRFQEDPYGGSGYSQTPNDLFFYQIVDALMAPLLTGAIVGFCLWLVLRATRPRRPHGE